MLVVWNSKSRCAYGGHDAAVAALLGGGADVNLAVDDEQGHQLTAVGCEMKRGGLGPMGTLA
jgi:hypothetical protein